MELVTGSRGTSVLLEPETARRVRYVLAHMQRAGHELLLTEGYRPVGQPTDQHVTDAARTSTGGSTQWFQWGRYQRGLTPSAAWPGTSRHGEGRAIDWNAPTPEGMRERARAMRLAGMVANVPSESWHAEPLAAPLVDLSPYQFAVIHQRSLKEAAMWLAKTVDTKRIYIVTTEGMLWLGSEKLVTYYRRMIEHHGGDGTEIEFYQAELNQIVAGFRAAAGGVSSAEIAKTLAEGIRGDVVAAIGKLDVQAGASASDIADEIARRLVEG